MYMYVNIAWDNGITSSKNTACIITCKCSVHFAIKISATECVCVCVCPRFLKCIQRLPGLKLCASFLMKACKQWTGKNAGEKSRG